MGLFIARCFLGTEEVDRHTACTDANPPPQVPSTDRQNLNTPHCTLPTAADTSPRRAPYLRLWHPYLASKLLEGGYLGDHTGGGTTGVVKRDTRSLDYSSCEPLQGKRAAASTFVKGVRLTIRKPKLRLLYTRLLRL